MILGMSLCVHLPSFDESHSSCHLLKIVFFALPRMMFLSSWGKCTCLRPYSSCSTHISFLSRAGNLIGGTPESTFAASLDNVRHPLIMRKFILRCTAPICLSNKYAGMQSSQVDALYIWIDIATVASNYLRAGHGPPTLGIIRNVNQSCARNRRLRCSLLHVVLKWPFSI